MECTLDAENSNIIAKAIQSLAKFGADLYIEADGEGLKLRTLNQSRSAAGCLTFKNTFFTRYIIGPNGDSYCRISMKAALAIFRNMRQVEHCDINMQPDADKFQVELTCRLDTVRKALIFVVDDENITAAVTPDTTSNVISGNHKVFTEISLNFTSTEEEITLEAMKEHLTAKNYIEGASVTDKLMRSQLQLEPGEFDKYEISEETSITFCLKEFRAFLHFAEALNSQITLNFNESGSPVFMNFKKCTDIECQLIMSTLDMHDVSRNDDITDADLIAAADTLMTNATTRGKSKKRPVTKRKRKQLEATTANVTYGRRRLADQTTLSNTSSVFANFRTQLNERHLSLRSANVLRNTSNEIVEKLPAVPSDTMPNTGTNDNVSAYFQRDLSESEIETQLEANIDSQIAGIGRRSSTPPTPTNVAISDAEEESAQSCVNVQEECIPQSPQRQHKIRSIFSRCFEATCEPMELSLDSQFFVPNSDSD